MADEEKGEKKVLSDRNESGKFVPGKPGGPGRPRGMRNKDTLRLDFWLSRIAEDTDLVEDVEKRLSYQFRLAELLLAKVANIPSSVSESVENAALAQLAAFDGQPKSEPVKAPEPVVV